jgi:hypothetical protein
LWPRFSIPHSTPRPINASRLLWIALGVTGLELSGTPDKEIDVTFSSWVKFSASTEMPEHL